MADPLYTPGGNIVHFICLVGGDGVPYGAATSAPSTPISFEAISAAAFQAAGGGATPLPLPNIPAGATYALIQSENGDVRYTPGAAMGLSPSNGMLIPSDANPHPISGALATYRFVQSTGQAGAQLNVSYFK